MVNRGAELERALTRNGVTDVDVSRLTRSIYSSDASLYRVEPMAVVRPRSVDEVQATLATCIELNIPLTSRGAGTSIAGNAVGPGVVMDFSKYLNVIHQINIDERTALVDPGVVLSTMQNQVSSYRLRFGPDPSTHNRATFGGMIGNNACGSRALGYGRTSENIRGLKILLADGQVTTVNRNHEAPSNFNGLKHIASQHLRTIRTEFGQFGRQVSGYAMENLLPERGFDLSRFLVGSEGTLAVVLQAEVDLVETPHHTVLVVLGYADMPTAADAVPNLLPHKPIAIEGIDRRIPDVVRARRGANAVPDLPRGDGWLFVELGADNVTELKTLANKLVSDANALDSLIVTDAKHALTLWRIREDGAGLSARSSTGEPAYAGWEDSAVPVPKLGSYLREFDELLDSCGFTGVPYGHLGEGCLHIRIDFPLTSVGGKERMREFLEAAADLVASHGGSLSGEHGDGRARSELLPRMYSPSAMTAMREVKMFFDPDGLLNPGVLINPASVTADLRTNQFKPMREKLALHYPHDHADFATAVHRCTGVGKCKATSAATGGVMCPSYEATRDEKDSTRGRARILQDAMEGRLGPNVWASAELKDVLDLCLSCRGCSSDCPTGVDIATYKSEVLHQIYQRKIRPRSHYTLGRLPSWSRLAGISPRLANATLQGVAGNLLKRVAGVDVRRSLPKFASKTFRSQFIETHDAGLHGDVMVWVDPFTDRFDPEVAHSVVRVLRKAGYRVVLSPKSAHCALTWISTGQLTKARRIVAHTVVQLLPTALSGIQIVGIEPSSTAVLRSDITHLLGTQDAVAVSRAVVTLAELLSTTPGWAPPDLSGQEIVAQPHCHHHAVMGWETDAALLASSGATVKRVSGCCGLAGNWGMEQGHYEVSIAVAESNILPAVKAKSLQAKVLADGFSCRTQLDDLAGQSTLHLAQLLDTEFSK